MPGALDNAQRKFGISKKDRIDHQAQVAGLFFRGFTKKDIIDHLGYPEGEIQNHLNVINSNLSPSTAHMIEYRRNKLLNKISLVQKKAWELFEEAGKMTKGGEDTKLSSLRVVISSQELEAKVEGVTQEKIAVVPADKQADGLLQKIKEMEEKARKVPLDDGPKGNGHKEATAEPLPDFLKDKGSA